MCKGENDSEGKLESNGIKGRKKKSIPMTWCEWVSELQLAALWLSERVMRPLNRCTWETTNTSQWDTAASDCVSHSDCWNQRLAISY